MINVSKRGGFSDRNAIKPENTEIQNKEFDARTRVQLVNMINRLYAEVFSFDMNDMHEDIQSFLKYMLGDVFSEIIEPQLLYSADVVFKKIKRVIQYNEYDDVLTVIEAIAQYWDLFLRKMRGGNYFDSYKNTYREPSIFEKINKTFQKEYVGYRFVDSLIVPITDPYELSAIKETLTNPYASVREHISKANKLLADRETPDYENSIKESISAVEAICEILSGLKGKEATLGNTIKKLEDNGVKIHGSLKSAFKSLYGYASDANGIRHAGDIGGPSATFEEAKFMLVSCCAFINYLIAIDAD